MNQPFTHTHEHAMHMWGKCSDDCRELLATQAKLLAACRKALAALTCDVAMIRTNLHIDNAKEAIAALNAAIAEAEGEKQ